MLPNINANINTTNNAIINVLAFGWFSFHSKLCIAHLFFLTFTTACYGKVALWLKEGTQYIKKNTGLGVERCVFKAQFKSLWLSVLLKPLLCLSAKQR